MFSLYFIVYSYEIVRIIASILGLIAGFIICRLVSEKSLKNKSIKFIITEIMR
jgi:glycopeptide antibiotics resistance protein